MFHSDPRRTTDLNKDPAAPRQHNFEPNASVRIVVGDPTDCPFPPELLADRFGFHGMPLTAEEAVRCLKARKHLPVRVLATIAVKCSSAPIVLPAGLRPAYRIRARHHVDLLIDGRRVHIEGVAQELGGPGGRSDELRVYVDGLLEGQSILLGRLGATVNTFPLVAAVGPELVMIVQPALWTQLNELIVELRQRSSII